MEGGGGGCRPRTVTGGLLELPGYCATVLLCRFLVGEWDSHLGELLALVSRTVLANRLSRRPPFWLLAYPWTLHSAKEAIMK